MGWINVENSNFAESGQSVQFKDDTFICKSGDGAGVKIPISDIVFLNRQPKAGRVSGGTDTNVFKNAFYIGAFLAVFAEFFRFFGADKNPKPKQKLNTKIIVKFANDKALSGKTSFDTFYAIQNAWLDSK